MATIHIRQVQTWFEDFAYRAPMKFRGTVVDRVTLLNVVVTGSVNGRTTQGYGSMPLGNVWSFPSATLTFDQTLAAMKQIAGLLPPIIESSAIDAHPIEINHLLEPDYLKAAATLNVAEPVPPLCTLVVASAFDAAIHDAYGKARGRSVYQTYGSEYMIYDLAHYLDNHFAGEYLDRYTRSAPVPSLHLYHLVGALDPLTGSDVKTRLNDGYPETLEEWVLAEGLDHIKVKLDGDNLQWDVERVLSIHRVLHNLQPNVGRHYSLDFNERCQSAGYVLECLAKIAEAAPAAFSAISYLEQPTARDLNAPGTPAMHEVAKIKPVVIDESLTDYQSLLRARELGYSGVALKACKGQSNALLMAAAAQKFGMFLCVQDLTCPGASLLHSAGLAAHTPHISALESNARQYVPAANKSWEAEFPGIFHIANGRLDTSVLDGPGLGVVPVASAQLLGA